MEVGKCLGFENGGTECLLVVNSLIANCKRRFWERSARDIVFVKLTMTNDED